MLKKIGFGFAVSVVLLANCSSDSDSSPSTDTVDCAAKSKCANDGPVPSETVATCKSVTTDATCGQAFRDLYRCGTEKQTCTADGVTDLAAVGAACASQRVAACKCAGVTGDGGSGSCPTSL